MSSQETIAITFDAAVGSHSEADYANPQAADDALDSGAYSMYVKAESYAGFTVSTNNVRIEIEPGATFTSGITLSGNNIEVLFGNGCDIQGVLTMSGDNVCVECENGCDFDGLIMSGASPYFDGGGKGTLVDGGTARTAVVMSGNDGIFKHSACQTTAGTGNAFHGIAISASRCRVEYNKVVDSDDNGIDVSSSGNNAIIIFNDVLGADANGIDLDAVECVVMGNYVVDADTSAIQVNATADDCTIVANICHNPNTLWTYSIRTESGCEDTIITANKVDGTAVSDGSGGACTIADNNSGSFV